jgi:hypothetical protein
MTVGITDEDTAEEESPSLFLDSKVENKATIVVRE